MLVPFLCLQDAREWSAKHKGAWFCALVWGSGGVLLRYHHTPGRAVHRPVERWVQFYRLLAFRIRWMKRNARFGTKVLLPDRKKPPILNS